MNNDMLLGIALGAAAGYLLAQHLQKSAAVSGYFPSGRPGALPLLPYTVRWGMMPPKADTTKYANWVS